MIPWDPGSIILASTSTRQCLLKYLSRTDHSVNLLQRGLIFLFIFIIFMFPSSFLSSSFSSIYNDVNCLDAVFGQTNVNKQIYLQQEESSYNVA